GVVPHGAAVEVGGARAGGDRVDADAAWAELDGQAAGEDLDGCLGRRVDRRTGADVAGQRGRHVDDAGAVGEVRHERLDEEERAAEVGAHERVEAVHRHVLQPTEQADPGVVDQDVELHAPPAVADLAGQLGGEGRERVDVADVELRGERVTTRVLDHLHGLRGPG